MEFNFDFQESANRLNQDVAYATNPRIEEIKMRTDLDLIEQFNEILNLMTTGSLNTAVLVLSEYHQALMEYLGKKGF